MVCIKNNKILFPILRVGISLVGIILIILPILDYFNSDVYKIMKKDNEIDNYVDEFRTSNESIVITVNNDSYIESQQIFDENRLEQLSSDNTDCSSEIELNELRIDYEAELDASREQNSSNASSIQLVSLCTLSVNSETSNIETIVWDNCDNHTLQYGAGFYPESHLPGEDGNCVIFGHNMRRSGLVFNQLSLVRINDVIEIQMSDGTLYRYTVYESKEIEEEDIYSYITTSSSVEPIITLITCHYNGNYKSRWIVIGRLI